jgi:hypothetical protein
MTDEQKYYLDMYNSEADKAYESMHDYRIDYDTFKPIADASSIMTEQAKKVYDKLYPIYINYPIFLKGLKNIYNNSKEGSDEDQETLKSKLDTLNEYRSKYNSWINKINALEVQINEDELSFQIDEIANLPENLERSNELALIEKEKEIEAARIAKEAADKAAAEKAIADKIALEKAKQETTIVVDEIIGIEVCLDNFGNQIDMSICRPSGGGGGGGGGEYERTAAQIVNENIENWLKGVEEAFKVKEVKPIIIAEPIAELNTIEVIEEPIVEPKPIEEPIVEPELILEPIVEVEPIVEPIAEIIEPEDIINSFIFKADLSKLISSELSSRQPIEAQIPEDELYPLDIPNRSIEKSSTLQEFNPIDSFIYKPNLIKPIEIAQPIPLEIDKVVSIKNDEIKPIIEVKKSNTSINNNTENSSKIMIAAAVLAVLVGYSIIKKKD